MAGPSSWALKDSRLRWCAWMSGQKPSAAWRLLTVERTTSPSPRSAWRCWRLATWPCCWPLLRWGGPIMGSRSRQPTHSAQHCPSFSAGLHLARCWAALALTRRPGRPGPRPQLRPRRGWWAYRWALPCAASAGAMCRPPPSWAWPWWPRVC